MKKTALIILDGWGHGQKDKSNAIFQAHTPYIDSLYKNTLNTELLTHGEFVGLPKGQMGNSEVGHLNIGAGRVVHQNLARINNDIDTGNFKTNKYLTEAIKKAKDKKKPIHVMGLFSNGGIHSHLSHLKAICNTAISKNIEHVYIHAFTDGRDSDPKSGQKFLEDFLDYTNNKNVSIASVIGRYYSMDRDRRWDRTSTAYHLMTNGTGKKTHNIIKDIKKYYKKNITDEFILPLVKVDKNNQPIATIQNDDIVICFNFRSDRCRQIINALTQLDIPQYYIKSLDINIYTMTCYDDTFENVKVLYPKNHIKNTLGEVIANKNLVQLRIAETEKYPHVTFFLSGGQEKEFEKEYRILIPSPQVGTYDLRPEMSSDELTSSFIQEIKIKTPDFVCLNYANPDMVGHTGNFKAVVTAIEKIDSCLKRVVNESILKNYTLIIIADHGNAEHMINKDGTENTAHTTNKVPCFIINSDYTKIKSGTLSDIAPTILNIMGIAPPVEMTGKNLLH